MISNIQPGFEDFKKLAKSHNLITIGCDFYGDTETPVTAYQKISDLGPSFLLESVTGGENQSRYSFVGSAPLIEVFVGETEVSLKYKSGTSEKFPIENDPLEWLENYLDGLNVAPNGPQVPPFTGGAVGYIGYEYIHHIEPTVPKPQEKRIDTPQAYFQITDAVICFDNAKQKIQLFAHALVENSLEETYERACESLRTIYEKLNTAEKFPLKSFSAPVSSKLKVSSNFSKEEFENSVLKVKDYIRDGDVFQTVLSQRFEAPFHDSSLNLYRSLRSINPSPYMTLLETADFSIVSASPEVHVKVADGLVEIRPIAGTRPRGATLEEDSALEKDLLSDEKEKAEHLMLVDLARNDIGRVCEIGSVTIPHFMIIERYSHVMHIVSQVLGKLKRSCNAFDLLRATFPAGTISGAPKVRAMQVISELEKTQRGIYSGALGYFGFDGSHDSAISIRTAVIKDQTIYIQAGAGLVADSNPESEYQETINKSMGIQKAVQQSAKDNR